MICCLEFCSDVLPGCTRGGTRAIESLNKKLRRFYNKFGTKDDSGQPVHSPSQVRKLAHKFAGKKERLNEGLAKKYKKSLADLSDTDSDDSETGDIALL